MTSQETCILEAVENGGYSRHIFESAAQTLLDPLFWQSLGRARGWWEAAPDRPGAHGQWLSVQIDFIRHLADGKDAESFFAAL
jgi:hypothetical protein